VLLVPYSRRRSAERLFFNAGVQPEWSPPPPADRIRQRDQERLLAEVAQADEPTDEDLAAANALLAERTPEELAAALVRMYRARLPAPEELSTPIPRPERTRTERPERLERDRPERRPERREEPFGRDGMVVFRMNIGRAANADPRWMIPVICRRGGITKNEIGAIRIMDRETQFEVIAQAAERFAEEARRPDAKDPNIRFATLNETLAASTGAEPVVARQYDKPRPFHKKAGGKPAFKGKTPYRGKPDFKARAEAPTKPEGRGKLFLKGGDRPLTKKKRPGRP
jgi:ATP-dependent RNA helicase DeaD